MSTDRTTLVNHYSTVEEFIAKIVDDVYEVCPRHFIAKAKAKHLKIAKENLSENELIISVMYPGSLGAGIPVWAPQLWCPKKVF